MELAKTNPELVALARQQSGEGFGTTIKYINFNGKDGVYFMSTGKKDEDGKTIKDVIGKEWDGGVLLKARNRVNVYEPRVKEWKSEEFDSYDQPITVKDQNGNVVAQGSFNELRLKDKDLRVEKVLYVYANDETYKLSAKGMGVKVYIDYMRSFDNTDTAVAYKTLFGAKQQESEFGAYWSITMTRGEPVDLETSVGLQQQLGNALNFQSTPTRTEAAISNPIEPVGVKQIEQEVSNWGDGSPLPEEPML